ncbi:MAG: terpene cyclase/mutase family protein [Planctomycetes bacterium]|nr:terpene cyclase/mutase family protein [Planctomycetota bacterium]
MSIDPTKYEIETTTPPMWEREETFQEIMAEQLRHAPWLMLSIVLHLLILGVLLLIPAESKLKEEKIIRMKPPEQVEEIEEIEEEEIIEEVEEVEEEVVIEETEVTEVEEVTETFEDVSDVKESAFDSDQWNSAVGLGGGAGGKTGGRRGGRGGLRKKGGKATARAIELALEWLKKHQDEDGKWDADEFMKHDVEGEPCDGPGNPVHDVGLTGLALLDFLGDGSTMRSGAYKDVVRKAVLWLRDQQDPESGLFGTNNSNEFIYNHAIAAYAMVEAYGLSKYKILKKNAQLGINYLERHRNPYSVWRYQPRDNDNDTSVTGWCVMAYKSAEDFKLEVNKTAMDLAEAWFDQMTDPTNGRCGYTERGGRSSRKTGDHASKFPREKGECMTAVSLLCRFFLGHDPKEDEMMAPQADLIVKQPAVWDEESGAIDHYYWYYATYALYQMGGRHWTTWEKSLTTAVVKPQRTEGNFKGSWDPVGVWGEDGGRVYSTAILCLTLEAYYRYTRLVR